MRLQDGLIADQARTVIEEGDETSVEEPSTAEYDGPLDETGAQNAFVAGMIFALTKRVSVVCQISIR